MTPVAPVPAPGNHNGSRHARARTARATAGVAAVGAACVTYGTVVERRWYRLRRLTVPGVVRSGGRLRVLHISDTHFHPRQEHRRTFLAAVAREEVDLVVATGDLVGARGAEEATVELLAPLVASRPGLVVLGSNDFYAPKLKSPHHYFTDPDARIVGDRLDTDRLVAGLQDTGWLVLRNDTTRLSADGSVVTAVGFDDPHLPQTVLPEPGTLADPGIGGADLRLGVVHAPYQAALDRLVAAGCDLLVAGHTHGGQVRLPPIGALVDNCDLPLRQARGLSRWGPAWLHVSPGLGHSLYAPFRFACRPEATVLDLGGARGD